MNSENRELLPIRWATWPKWVLATILGLVLGSTLGLLILFPEALSVPGGVDVMNVFRGMPAELAPSSPTALSRAIAGAVAGAGLMVGALQWLILRRHFDRAGRWILASTLGLAVALALGGAIGGLVSGAIAGTVVGISEWFVMRRYVYKAGLWIVGNTIGFAAAMIVGSSVFSLAFGILFGGVTGGVLVWLLRSPVSITAEQFTVRITPKIKRPASDRLYRLFMLFAILMVPIGACIVTFFITLNNPARFVLFGLLVAIVPILLMRFWVGRRRKVFARSSATAKAKVVDQKKVGGTLGSLGYRLIIEFDAVRPDTSIEPIMLEVTVPRDIHEYAPGASLDVRYSTEDPTVAILEYEFAEHKLD